MFKAKIIAQVVFETFTALAVLPILYGLIYWHGEFSMGIWILVGILLFVALVSGILWWFFHRRYKALKARRHAESY